MECAMMTARHTQRGIGLVEILVTLLIISFGLLAHVTFQRFTFHEATLAGARSTATDLALDKLEDLRAYTVVPTTTGAQAFADIGDDTGGTLPAGNVTLGNTVFTRHWSVVNYWYTATNAAPVTAAPAGNPLPDLKRVTLTIGWTDIDGKAQSLSMSSIIAGADPAAAGRVYQ